MQTLRTSDLARAAGIHPNTVRRYEQWGLIPPAERGANGYRRFTREHLDCLRLARFIFEGAYAGRVLRQSALQIIEAAVAGDWRAALEAALRHQGVVQAEAERAARAAALLEGWAAGPGAPPASPAVPGLSIGQAAARLGVSVDILRNWERSGLVEIPRHPHSRYRQYGPPQLERLQVIRMLVQAGYSLMAILRMLTLLDAGRLAGAAPGFGGAALDSPPPGEDVYSAADRWLSTLAAEERRAAGLLELVRAGLAARLVI